jgi:hypothetical protein
MPQWAASLDGRSPRHWLLPDEVIPGEHKLRNPPGLESQAIGGLRLVVLHNLIDVRQL